MEINRSVICSPYFARNRLLGHNPKRMDPHPEVGLCRPGAGFSNISELAYLDEI